MGQVGGVALAGDGWQVLQPMQSCALKAAPRGSAGRGPSPEPPQETNGPPGRGGEVRCHAS